MSATVARKEVLPLPVGYGPATEGNATWSLESEKALLGYVHLHALKLALASGHGAGDPSLHPYVHSQQSWRGPLQHYFDLGLYQHSAEPQEHGVPVMVSTGIDAFSFVRPDRVSLDNLLVGGFEQYNYLIWDRREAEPSMAEGILEMLPDTFGGPHAASVADSTIYSQSGFALAAGSSPTHSIFATHAATTSVIAGVCSYFAGSTATTSPSYISADHVICPFGRSQPQNIHSELANRIISERSGAEVDPENAHVADAAMRDALEAVRHANLVGKPLVMFSEDGILALQWQRGDFGAALIFAGDGMTSIAFRRPGQLYAENGIEVPVSQELPREFYDVLTRI